MHTHPRAVPCHAMPCSQARAHRIGQDKPVTVIRLLSQDSIEEHIYAVADEKRRFADSSITGGARRQPGTRRGHRAAAA